MLPLCYYNSSVFGPFEYKTSLFRSPEYALLHILMQNLFVRQFLTGTKRLHIEGWVHCLVCIKNLKRVCTGWPLYGGIGTLACGGWDPDPLMSMRDLLVPGFGLTGACSPDMLLELPVWYWPVRYCCCCCCCWWIWYCCCVIDADIWLWPEKRKI